MARGTPTRATGVLPVQRGSNSASVVDGWNSIQGQDSGSAGSEVSEGPGRRLRSPGRRYSSEQLGLHVLAGADGQGIGREGIGDMTVILPHSCSSEQHRHPSPRHWFSFSTLTPY